MEVGTTVAGSSGIVVVAALTGKRAAVPAVFFANEMRLAEVGEHLEFPIKAPILLPTAAQNKIGTRNPIEGATERLRKFLQRRL